MPVGIVKTFDRRQGWGYITPEGGGADVFVHVSAIERAGLSDLSAGARVRFDVQTDRARGKSFAANLSLL